MIPEKYLNQLQTIIRKFFPEESTKVFLFGSAVNPKRQKFFDVDVGLLGDVDHKKISDLKETLEESTFPYIVDIIDFEKAEKSFSEFVLSQTPIKWI